MNNRCSRSSTPMACDVAQSSHAICIVDEMEGLSAATYRGRRRRLNQYCCIRSTTPPAPSCTCFATLSICLACFSWLVGSQLIRAAVFELRACHSSLICRDTASAGLATTHNPPSHHRTFLAKPPCQRHPITIMLHQADSPMHQDSFEVGKMQDSSRI